MRPRRFVTSQQELKDACEQLRRIGPPPQPNGVGTLLVAILCLWGLISGLGAARDWLCSHAIPAPPMPLVQVQPKPKVEPIWPPAINEVRRLKLPDGQSVQTTCRGEIPKGATYGWYWHWPVQLGDMYKYGVYYWVWAVPVGGTTPTWIDP